MNYLKRFANVLFFRNNLELRNHKVYSFGETADNYLTDFTNHPLSSGNMTYVKDVNNDFTLSIGHRLPALAGDLLYTEFDTILEYSDSEKDNEVAEAIEMSLESMFNLDAQSAYEYLKLAQFKLSMQDSSIPTCKQKQRILKYRRFV